MRPLKALEPLRLKSPSSPWPIASCSSTPGQPGPSTTSSRRPSRARFEVRQCRVHRVVHVALDHARPGNSRGRSARPRRRCPTRGAVRRRPSARRSPSPTDAPVAERRPPACHRRAPPSPRRIHWPVRPSPARRAGPWRGPVFSTFPSNATFAVLSSVAIGSWPRVQQAAAGHCGAGDLHAAGSAPPRQSCAPSARHPSATPRRCRPNRQTPSSRQQPHARPRPGRC